MKYTVKKNKWNRFAFRFVGLVFMIVGLVNLIGFYFNLVVGKKIAAVICAALVGICIIYGGYLIKETFKLTAYDITYIFEEEFIRIIGKHKERILMYENIDDACIVVPTKDMDYVILQIKVKKIQYILPFINNVEYGQRICDFIEDKRK